MALASADLDSLGFSGGVALSIWVGVVIYVTLLRDSLEGIVINALIS